MEERAIHGLGRRWLTVLALVSVVVGGMAMLDAGVEAADTVASTQATCVDDGTQLQIHCPALPSTNAKGKITNGVLDYDIFAWNSFIAMSWPALDPASYNNQRGFPDVSKSFAGAQPGDLTVWETLKEKREIFLADPFTGEPVPATEVDVAPWNSEPVYGPSDNQVPTCPDAPQIDVSFERHIAHATKLNSAFDTLDETAEVASEARETNQVLCQGHDADCDVHGQPVGPRVWLNRKSGSVPLLYEVKVNWDFYNYLDNFHGGKLWIQPNARAAAPQGTIRLPARTSGGSAPPLPGSTLHQGGVTPNPVPGPNPIVTDYHATGCLAQAEVVTPSTNVTPCPAGSVHLKAAWVPLDEPSDEYHTATAYYYEDYDPQPGQPGYPVADRCKSPALYGLVGLHIIQRIHEFVDNQHVHAPGGTFVFATWEHVGNDTADFTYANLYPTTSKTPKPYPNVDPSKAIPLKRAYAPLETTENANQMVHKALGCSNGSGSVWCNYKLIGTQYQAAHGPPPGFDVKNPPEVLPSSPMTTGYEFPEKSGQPYFLANLVVESNVGLQQFLGLPPGATPIDHYASPQVPPGGSGRVGNDGVTSNTATGYDLSKANLAYRIAPRTEPAYSSDKTTRDQHKTIIHDQGGSSSGRKIGAYNMGGCMGCHGVAQLNGYSFSFVLLGNQEGGIPDTLTDVDIPPPPITSD